MATHYRWGDGCEGWHLLDRPDLSVIKEVVPVAAGESLHLHRKSRQLFFLLSGQLVIERDGAEHALGPHDSLEVPPGVPHRLVNCGAEPAHFLVVSSPHSHGDRVAVDGPATD